MRISLDDWTDWSTVETGAALWHIRTRQLSCYDCLCDEEGGLYGLSTSKDPLGGQVYYTGSKKCRSQTFANRCGVMLGCFCTADLIQPVPEDNTIPISVFQQALDNLPDTVQGHNPDYRWNYGGGTLRFTQPRRYLDPTTAEPYYLEGPSVGMNQEYLQYFRSIFGPSAEAFDLPENLQGPGGGESSRSGGGGGAPGGSGNGDPGGSRDKGPWDGGPWDGGPWDGSPGGSGSAGPARVKREEGD
ncbi:hypothetical protein TWF718_009569 [Orbilia javanica]|uniref:Uncharacterized protein n=1 Tax=Orbilia javanica TaxID=47235 RepID=A0AAN8MJ36_9PEZI